MLCSSVEKSATAVMLGPNAGSTGFFVLKAPANRKSPLPEKP
jgi:hypothetical protein